MKSHRTIKKPNIILLIGGTSETSGLAEKLASAGYEVIVSLATGIRLNAGNHRRIRVRRGRLDLAAMCALVRRENCAAIVCAAHPYAVLARKTCAAAARKGGLPLYVFDRPALSGQELRDCVICRDHKSAARKAFQLGDRVLLTTGSKTLLPYVHEARRTGAHLVVRVLPDPESVLVCKQALIPDDAIISRRGPFSARDNLTDIRRHKIQVLVTKNSGLPGGTSEKIVAARRGNCRVVVVERPPDSSRGYGQRFQSVAQLIAAIINNLRLMPDERRYG